MKKKLKIGWFSFTCCEDSTIMFTELLNDHYEDWFDKIDFKHARVLQGKNKLKNLDVAFVEGAISSELGKKEVKKIRKNSRKVIAIGSCAINGMPSAQRNDFDDRTKEEIKFLLERFGHLKEVHPLHDIIKVDDEVPGCPMDTNRFLEVLNNLLKEFKIA